MSIYSGIVRLLDIALGDQDHRVEGLVLVAPDSRESDVRAQLSRPAFSRVADPRVRYPPHGSSRGTGKRWRDSGKGFGRSRQSPARSSERPASALPRHDLAPDPLTTDILDHEPRRTDAFLGAAVDLRPHETSRQRRETIGEPAEERRARPYVLEQEYAAIGPDDTTDLAQP